MRAFDYNIKTETIEEGITIDGRWRTLPEDWIIDMCRKFGWITMVEWDEDE